MIEAHTLSQTGASLPKAVDWADTLLDEPLATELSDEQLIRRQRQKIAEDNAEAQERLLGLMSMPRSAR